tara:strand:- start:1033 stop:1254 length:222 start_codon:yes stop_codon:yes gene_type:complete
VRRAETIRAIAKALDLDADALGYAAGWIPEDVEKAIRERPVLWRLVRTLAAMKQASCDGAIAGFLAVVDREGE